MCWRVEAAVEERQFIRKPASDTQAVSGSNVTLECAAQGGKPVPRLTWKRRGGSALPGGRHSVKLGMSVRASVVAMGWIGGHVPLRFGVEGTPCVLSPYFFGGRRFLY